MTLPASLLASVERHSCFSGCYEARPPAFVCIDPAQSTVRTLRAKCEDCFSFHIGALESTLPKNMTADQLAEMLSEHMRKLRGYAWSVGGYHYSSKGIWLNAAYYPCGVFLLDGDRNNYGGSDLQVLIEYYKAGFAQPEHPDMLDASKYATQEVYIDMTVPITPVRNKDDILQSQQCSTSYQSGANRVTLAEFLPIAQRHAPGPAAAAAVPQSRPTPGKGVAIPPQRATQLGDRCPICGEIVKVRPSLTKTFTGCLC